MNRVIDRYGRVIYEDGFVISKHKKMIKVTHPHFPGKVFVRNNIDTALQSFVDMIGESDEQWVIDRMVPCVRAEAKSGQCVVVTYDKMGGDLIVCLGLNVVVFDIAFSGVLVTLLLEAMKCGELPREGLEDAVMGLEGVLGYWNGWRSIDELDVGVDVLLCYLGEDDVVIGSIDEEGFIWVNDESYNKWCFSHWRPMPKAV